MANKGRKEKEEKDKERYYGVWKFVEKYDNEFEESELVNFQTNHIILCRESFNSPTLLILNDLSELQIFEHSLETNILKPYELDDSTKKIKKPNAYFGITEEINYSIFIFGGLYYGKKSQIDFIDKLYRISLKNKTLLEVEIRNKENEKVPSARCGSSLTYVSFPFPHLLLFGGVTEEGTFSNELWCFNILQLRWDKVESSGFIPPPMELHSALIFNKSLIIVGGLLRENNVYKTSEYIYWLDLERAVWHRKKGGKRVNRANHSTQVYQDELIIYGVFRINNSGSKESPLNDEMPIKSNYTDFHKNILLESNILNNINIVHLTSNEVDDIYFDNDITGIEMIPLSGASSFMNKNVFGVFKGVSINKNEKKLEENMSYYTCEIGAPPSPYHIIPYNINCSSFDLVWKETCDLNDKFCMKRTYSIEIARLTNDTELTAIDGMQPIYIGEKTKCHVDKIIFGNKFVSPIYPDSNYKIRTYSFTKFNDFERMVFPEIIVKTAPCDIIKLPDPNYYYFEKEKLFIFNWVNEEKNKYPCIHTKYYFTALPLYIENSNSNKDKHIIRTDLNSALLYIGLEREISFTIDQLLKMLSEDCKGFESIKDKSKLYILFRIEQYNLVRDQVALFDAKQVIVALSDNNFEKFISEDEIFSFLNQFEIKNFIDSDEGNVSESDTRRTRNTRTVRSRTRNQYSMRRKRTKTDSTSEYNNSNVEDREIKFNFISDISPKKIKRYYRNDGGIFNLKLFRDNIFIDIDYEYFDKATVDKNKKPISIKMENNVIYNDKAIYRKLNNYFENTSDHSKKENVVFSKDETDKYNTYYTKGNIKKFKEAFFESFNIKRKRNYSKRMEQTDEKEKRSWELNRIPPKYICFGTINSSLCLNTFTNELYFTGKMCFQKKKFKKVISNSEKKAIFTFMKYNKEYIFKNYSPRMENISKNEESIESDDSIKTDRSLSKRSRHERSFSWHERSYSKYYKTSKGERRFKLDSYSESEDGSRSDGSLKSEPATISYPDSLSSFISETSNSINIDDILSKIKDDDDKCIKFSFLDKNITRNIICINDKQKFKPNDISLFII